MEKKQTRGEIEREIRTFIMEDVLEESDQADVPEDIPLLSGLLDSFGLMSLISFLEDRYEIVVGNDEVVKQNFESLAALAGFVEARLEGGSAAGDEVAAAASQ